MDAQIKTWLSDILTSIEYIEAFLGDGPKLYANYRSNIMLKNAVERRVAIIGEAMSRILKADPSFKLSHARQIVDTRNRVVHGYDSVSDEMMWGIVINHLPPLKAEVEKLLANP
jgi:uncharacterized protein with HEPN domain